MYVGRAGVVMIPIPGEMPPPGKTPPNKMRIPTKRFPRKSSIWANPFKMPRLKKGEKILPTEEESRSTKVISEYREYIVKQIAEDPVTYDISKLCGKHLGCWCFPKARHADILRDMCDDIDNIRNSSSSKQ